MQVGRLILDAAQREGLDGAVAGFIQAVDYLRLEEALGLEIVHQVVGVIGRGMAGATLALAQGDPLAAQLGGGGPRPSRVAGHNRPWGPLASPPPPGTC